MKRLILTLVSVVLICAPVVIAETRKAAPTPAPGSPKLASPEEAKMAIAAVNAAKTDKEILIAIKRLGEVYYPKNPSTVKLALSLVMDPRRSIKARAGAAAVLGKFRDKSVVPLLNKYVIDPRVKKEVALSTAIVGTLGLIAHPSSILPLKKLSTYKETPVAVASAKALGKIKDKRAVDELIKIFDVTEDPDDASSSRQKRYAQIAAVARSALISLTKESFPAARDYRKWWKAHKAEFIFEPPKAIPTPVPTTKRK